MSEEQPQKKKPGRPRTNFPDPNAPKGKPGRPRKHPPPDPDAPKRPRGRPRKEEQPDEPEQGDTSQSAVEWARAILWAVENVGSSKMTKRRAGSPIRYALWEFGRENTKSLVVHLMPKAMAILDRADSASVEEGVEEAESQAVEEIDKLIKAAIEESKEEQQ